MNKIIVIVGPTASGKTQLAVELTKIIKGEIINADAFQVYRELNVGINKPTPVELKTAKFHLVNNISILDDWNIKMFQEQAQKIIVKIIKNKKIPIICGGSHLYVDTLIKQYNLSENNFHNKKYENYSMTQLTTKLDKRDHEEFIKIGNNKRRLIRALEIMDDIKMSKSKHDINISYAYDCLVIRCHLNRDKLYQKINLRVEDMWNNGWKQEIIQLTRQFKNLNDLNAFKAIGYQIIYESIINNADTNLELIKQKTRNFAKRQITWSKNRYPNQVIFSGDNFGEILTKVQEFLNE